MITMIRRKNDYYNKTNKVIGNYVTNYDNNNNYYNK